MLGTRHLCSLANTWFFFPFWVVLYFFPNFNSTTYLYLQLYMQCLFPPPSKICCQICGTLYSKWHQRDSRMGTAGDQIGQALQLISLPKLINIQLSPQNLVYGWGSASNECVASSFLHKGTLQAHRVTDKETGCQGKASSRVAQRQMCRNTSWTHVTGTPFLL